MEHHEATTVICFFLIMQKLLLFSPFNRFMVQHTIRWLIIYVFLLQFLNAANGGQTNLLSQIKLIKHE